MNNKQPYGTYAIPGFLYGITDLCSVLVEGAPEPVLAIDNDYRIVLLNRAGERWLGHARAQVLGQPIFSAIADSAQLLEAIDSALRQGRSASTETTKGERAFTWRILPLTDKFGAKHGAICLLHDVSRARRAEKRLHELERTLAEKEILLGNRATMAQSIIDANKDPLFVLDRHLRVRAANKAGAGFCNYDRELVGAAAADVFAGLWAPGIMDQLGRAFGGEEVVLENVSLTKAAPDHTLVLTPLSFADTPYAVLLTVRRAHF